MLDLIKKLNKKDFIILAIASIVIILISFIEPITFLLNTPDGMSYNWRNAYATGDSYVYYGYIDQAKAGNILFRDLYQHDSQYIIFNWFWLLLGNVAKVFNLSAIFIYFLFKVLLIPFSVFTLYLFLFYVFDNKIKAQLGLGLGLFGTGLGIFIASIITPIDVLVEGSIFASFLSSPHLILIRPLFILIILNTLLFLDTAKYKYSIYAGISGLLLFQFHPFVVITLGSLLIIYFLFLFFIKHSNRWKFFKHSLIILIISSPSIFYHFIMFLNNPWWKIQSSDITLKTPSIFFILLSFLPFLIFAIIGIRKKQYLKHIDFFIFWFFINLFVPYLPIGFQSRLFLGFFIVLLIFTIQGISYFLKNIKQVKLFYYIPIIFILFFYTSTMMIISRVLVINDTNIFFIDKNYLITADWIKQNTDINNIFLSEDNIANIIAGRSLRKTFVGHYAETINYKIKREMMIDFFTSMNEEERLYFLKKNNIYLLIYDNRWKEKGVFDAELDKNLEKIFMQDNIIIYKIKNQQLLL